MAESFDAYEGWLSRSWLQDEIINVDVLPAQLTLPRRYCFRYVKIEVIDTSARYKVRFDDIYCTTVTSGDITKVPDLPADLDAELREIDRISVKTLQDCMQTVFEDGAEERSKTVDRRFKASSVS